MLQSVLGVCSSCCKSQNMNQHLSIYLENLTFAKARLSSSQPNRLVFGLGYHSQQHKEANTVNTGDLKHQQFWEQEHPLAILPWHPPLIMLKTDLKNNFDVGLSLTLQILIQIVTSAALKRLRALLCLNFQHCQRTFLWCTVLLKDFQSISCFPDLFCLPSGSLTDDFRCVMELLRSMTPKISLLRAIF